MTNIKIVDESGDKKYFTQLPHYILNHSTAIDQALYWQMKRYAGENGKCFATQETLMQKMKIGRMVYKKSLKYLLEKKWIKFIGTTKGKTRPIKTYAITDIWQLNIMNYEKIPSETTVSFQKIPSETTGDTGQNSSKIPSGLAIEEEQRKEEHIKNNYVLAGKPADSSYFSFNETLENWINGENRLYSLIGRYFKSKQLTFNTKEQMQTAAKRHLRAAKSISVFSDEQIQEAIAKIGNGNNINLQLEWTLETVLKYLTK